MNPGAPIARRDSNSSPADPVPGTPIGARAAFWPGLQSDCDMKIALAEHGSRINRDIVPMEQAA